MAPPIVSLSSRLTEAAVRVSAKFREGTQMVHLSVADVAADLR